MKFLVNLVIILMLTVAFTSSCNAQDVTYSQFFNNQLYYNPAYAGMDYGLHAKMHYRNQWNKLASRFDNYTLSIDAAEPNLPGAGGLGIIIQSDLDGIGNIQTTSATLATSVKLNVTSNLLTQFGISAGFVRRTLDWDELVFSDQIDPRYGVINPSDFVRPEYNSINYPDFGTGIVFQFCEETDKIQNVVGTIAVSAQHVFQPDISFYEDGTKLPVKLVVMGDLLMDNESNTSIRGGNKNKFKINPAFLYERQGKMSNFSIGLNGYKSFIYTGIWFRNQSFTFAEVKDLVIMLGANIPFGSYSRIKVRYSYDYILSDIRRVAGATHEISVVYELDGFSFFGSSAKSNSRGLSGRSKSCLDCAAF